MEVQKGSECLCLCVDEQCSSECQPDKPASIVASQHDVTLDQAFHGSALCQRICLSNASGSIPPADVEVRTTHEGFVEQFMADVTSVVSIEADCVIISACPARVYQVFEFGVPEYAHRSSIRYSLMLRLMSMIQRHSAASQ
jgi:hypothetical protein